jgi:hypothetical protein
MLINYELRRMMTRMMNSKIGLVMILMQAKLMYARKRAKPSLNSRAG